MWRPHVENTHQSKEAKLEYFDLELVKVSSTTPAPLPPVIASNMLLRDHFAAMAMQAMRSKQESYAYSVLAKEAYLIADAMMKARDE